MEKWFGGLEFGASGGNEDTDARRWREEGDGNWSGVVFLMKAPRPSTFMGGLFHEWRWSGGNTTEGLIWRSIDYIGSKTAVVETATSLFSLSIGQWRNGPQGTGHRISSFSRKN